MTQAATDTSAPVRVLHPRALGVVATARVATAIKAIDSAIQSVGDKITAGDLASIIGSVVPPLLHMAEQPNTGPDCGPVMGDVARRALVHAANCFRHHLLAYDAGRIDDAELPEIVDGCLGELKEVLRRSARALDGTALKCVKNSFNVG